MEDRGGHSQSRAKSLCKVNKPWYTAEARHCLVCQETTVHREKRHEMGKRSREMCGLDEIFHHPCFPCQLDSPYNYCLHSASSSDEGKSGFAFPRSPELREESLWLLNGRNFPCAKKAKDRERANWLL